MATKGHIIVPKSGQLLAELGAVGLPPAGPDAWEDAPQPHVDDAAKLNAAIFESLGSPENAKKAVDAINDFTRTKMREDGFFRRLLPPLSVTLDDDEEAGVDVAFWYYRNTNLIYSVRRVADNWFYDFATKKFSLMPASPRAGIPRVEPTWMDADSPEAGTIQTRSKQGKLLRPVGYVYSTRLSGKLADGEYVVTIRDSDADDVVIGVMAVFMEHGTQTQCPPQGLEDTPIEQGIPSPEGTFRRAAARVRPVDVGEPD